MSVSLFVFLSIVSRYHLLIADHPLSTNQFSHPNLKVRINMLTLDCLTLFFHYCSAIDKSHAGIVDEWAADVRRTALPPKRTPTRSLLSGDHGSLKSKTQGQSGLSTSSELMVGDESVETDPTLVTAKSHKSSLQVLFLFAHTLNHLIAA